MAPAMVVIAACGTHTGGTPTGPGTPPMRSDASPQAAAPAWPSTRREDVTEVLHGVTVVDPYRWLEAGDAAEVTAWADAQDVYARAELAKLPGRAALRDRLRELAYYDAIGVPIRKRGRVFYSRRQADKEKELVYWKGKDGVEHLLFDPSAWSADGSRSLGEWVPSDDGSLVAYKVSENNADEAVIRIIDVATGKDRSDEIPGARWAIPAWTHDGRGFYYTWLPPIGRYPVEERAGHAEVRYHAIGDAADADAIVVPASGNVDAYPEVTPSQDGHWLVLTISYGWNSSEVLFKDLRARDAAFVPLVLGVDAKFTALAWRDRFYVLTDDGATRFHLFKVDPRHPARGRWKEIVAERPDATLESFTIVGDHLALAYLHDAASETRIHDLDGVLVRTLELPPFGTSEGVSGSPDDDIGYFTYTSFTEAKVIYETSLATGAVTEYARVKLPLDTSALVTEQVWFSSKDGTRVPMFLIHKKGIEKTGKNPTLLNGYGAYGFSQTPEYTASRTVWLEQGGVYAIANLRGGGEFGEAWHRAGSLLNKQSSFDDFLAAAHYLVDEGWTSPEHLGIIGASNGGLLVGAAMTQAPALFRAVICLVPLLDMVRYQRFGQGPTWISEFGSADDPAQFAALYAYSPYHHVVDGTRYPALLVVSADHDDRVDPMHARKFVARVQAASAGDRPVLLRIERNAGHAGADLVKQQIERSADIYAFAAAQLAGE